MYVQKKTNLSGLEANLKKALTELLVLSLFDEKDMYIGEISKIFEERSGGEFTVAFPYAAIYRITQSGYLEEVSKGISPDGRLRKYYAITEAGRDYLQDLLRRYHLFIKIVEKILDGDRRDK